MPTLLPAGKGWALSYTTAKPTFDPHPGRFTIALGNRPADSSQLVLASNVDAVRRHANSDLRHLGARPEWRLAASVHLGRGTTTRWTPSRGKRSMCTDQALATVNANVPVAHRPSHSSSSCRVRATKNPFGIPFSANAAYERPLRHVCRKDKSHRMCPIPPPHRPARAIRAADLGRLP